MPAVVYEVPTIDGLVPGVFAGVIDSGMRSGIPYEDWGAVVTVYGDAGGNIRRAHRERGPAERADPLLDESGKVIWFHDRGYSARLVLDLLKLTGRGPLTCRTSTSASTGK